MNLTAITALLGVHPDLNYAEGPAIDGHVWGVTAFMGVYFLLLLWLFFMPSRLLDEPAGRPLWRSSRLWAIAIAEIQILVYLVLG